MTKSHFHHAAPAPSGRECRTGKPHHHSAMPTSLAAKALSQATAPERTPFWSVAFGIFRAFRGSNQHPLPTHSSEPTPPPENPAYPHHNNSNNALPHRAHLVPKVPSAPRITPHPDLSDLSDLFRNSPLEAICATIVRKRTNLTTPPPHRARSAQNVPPTSFPLRSDLSDQFGNSARETHCSKTPRKITTPTPLPPRRAHLVHKSPAHHRPPLSKKGAPCFSRSLPRNLSPSPCVLLPSNSPFHRLFSHL